MKSSRIALLQQMPLFGGISEGALQLLLTSRATCA